MTVPMQKKQILFTFVHSQKSILTVLVKYKSKNKIKI